MTQFTFIVATIVASSSGLVGCGNGGDDGAAETVQHDVDPRFVTADALLQEYNAITTREPVNAQAAYDLFYAENNLQRRWINISRNMIPVAELDYLLFQKFNEGWIKDRKKPMLAPDQPAKMVKVEPQRAEATLVDSDGKTKNLLLVQIGDRWWVSGYTIEHDPDPELQKELKQIDHWERLISDISLAVPAVTAKVRDGTITSAQDARKALALAVIHVTLPSK